LSIRSSTRRTTRTRRRSSSATRSKIILIGTKFNLSQAGNRNQVTVKEARGFLAEQTAMLS
jgi:hypothetical protein